MTVDFACEIACGTAPNRGRGSGSLAGRPHLKLPYLNDIQANSSFAGHNVTEIVKPVFNSRRWQRMMSSFIFSRCERNARDASRSRAIK